MNKQRWLFPELDPASVPLYCWVGCDPKYRANVAVDSQEWLPACSCMTAAFAEGMCLDDYLRKQGQVKNG